MTDSDAVWEVVSHEATHVMQACNSGPVIKDSMVPRVLRELQETAPHYYATLQGYRGDHKRLNSKLSGWNSVLLKLLSIGLKLTALSN